MECGGVPAVHISFRIWNQLPSINNATEELTGTPDSRERSRVRFLILYININKKVSIKDFGTVNGDKAEKIRYCGGVR